MHTIMLAMVSLIAVLVIAIGRMTMLHCQMTDSHLAQLDETVRGLQRRLYELACPYRIEHGPQPHDINCGRGLPEELKKPPLPPSV